MPRPVEHSSRLLATRARPLLVAGVAALPRTATDLSHRPTPADASRSSLCGPRGTPAGGAEKNLRPKSLSPRGIRPMRGLSDPFGTIIAHRKVFRGSLTEESCSGVGSPVRAGDRTGEWRAVHCRGMHRCERGRADCPAALKTESWTSNHLPPSGGRAAQRAVGDGQLGHPRDHGDHSHARPNTEAAAEALASLSGDRRRRHRLRRVRNRRTCRRSPLSDTTG